MPSGNSQPSTPPTELIVGGGITGLTLAWHLHNAGRRPLVLEAAPRVGGAIHTQPQEGYRLETGPNTVLATPAVRQLLEELGLSARLVKANSAHSTRYILRKGKLRGLRKPPDLLFGDALPLGARLRLLLEPFHRSRHPNPTVHQFFANRLGVTASDVLVSAFVAGVWAGDPKFLEMQTAFRTVWAGVNTHGSLLGHLRAQRKAQASSPVIFTLPNGLSEMVAALEMKLPEGCIRTGCDVATLQKRQHGWELAVNSPDGWHTLLVPSVILTTPAYHQGELVASFAPMMARRLAAIPYPRVRMVHLGYPTAAIQQPLNGFGFLVPATEGKKLLGAIWNSAQFAGVAPEGHALFTLFGGGSRHPQCHPAADLVKDFAEIMGIEIQPTFQHETLWERAIPQYTIGHHQNELAAHVLEASQPGLYLAGNWRGGIGVPDCIANARNLADRIVADGL